MKYVVLALFVFGCTLVAPAMVWALSGRRPAIEAWKSCLWFFGVPLAIGGVMLAFMLVFPPMP